MIIIILLLAFNLFAQEMRDEDILLMPEINIFDKKYIYLEKRKIKRQIIPEYRFNITCLYTIYSWNDRKISSLRA